MSEALKKFGITRSLKDRVFLGALGLLFGIPTGYAFYLRFTRPKIEAGDAWERAVGWFAVEGFAVVFLLSACAVIWAVAAPHWLEKKFYGYIGHFVILLGVASLAVFAMFIYAMLHGA